MDDGHSGVTGGDDETRDVGQHPLRGLGELGQGRLVADHTALNFLRHERRMGGIDQGSKIEGHECSSCSQFDSQAG